MQEIEELIPKKKANTYFTQETEDAIVEFQREESLEKKKQIFVDKIQPSFLKLVENIIFVYNFHTLGNIDILKSDCLSFLFEVLYKYDPSRGHKAFSYFNVIAKNWFIQKVKSHKKKSKLNVQLDKNVITSLEKDNSESVVCFYEDSLIQKEFLELLKSEIKKWRYKFDKYQERKVLEAIIVLIQNPDFIPIYNKKCIYLLLREQTGLNTKQIVTNLTKLKKKYVLFKKRYYNGEI